MNSNYSIDVLAEEGLGLVAKLLLFFERKQISVKQMTLEEMPHYSSCSCNFLVVTNQQEMEKTSSFISKQVGVMEVDYYLV